MSDKKIAQNLDDEMLKLMHAITNFVAGKTTLNDLAKAEEAAEMYRCWQPLPDYSE